MALSCDNDGMLYHLANKFSIEKKFHLHCFHVDYYCGSDAAGISFQQFYNMVDTIIVGKCLGVSSLAAVGSTGSINFMIIGFCTGACSGFAIPVAQKFGAGDYKRE